MKILLVALNAKYVHSNLAVYDIYSYANKDKKYNDILFVKEFTINNNLDYIMHMLYKENPDIIAFSCYIWNIKEILSLSKEITKIKPSIKIWLGGPEVSYNSEDLLRKYDFISGVICGEGEETFSELMKAWTLENANRDRCRGENANGDRCLYSLVKGITYRSHNSANGEADEIITTANRPLISMDEIPFIYEDFSEFKNKIIYYETSRGCPFSCSYCLSSIDKSVRFRSLDIVYTELQKFLDAKVPQVKFIDRTFNCNKDRALKIWKYLTDNDNGITNFHFEISADLIGEEEIEQFSKMRPGLIQLEIGLQSTNDSTIHEIRRIMNIEKLKNNMLKVRSLHNIHQHLDLIAGLPFEDFESFKKSFCDAYAMRPHQLQLGFLKVLKGSYMEEMAKEYGLVYHDEQPYEIMSTKWISYDEIIVLKHVEEMVELYHNSGQFDNVLPYVLGFFDNPFEFFYELGSFYEENHFFDIGFKREARYVALRDFIKTKISDLNTFDYLLSFDYYLRENAKTRPAWAKEEPIDKKTYQGFFINGGTSDFSLINELGIDDYDSKVASRIMHIEPISVDAYLKLERNNSVNIVEADSDVIYCLYDYNNRNPLSNEAKVYFIAKL